MQKLIIQKIKHRYINNNKGQSLVEFAILLPVLLIMLLGLMEWGFLLWTQTTFVNAAREGARDAVVIRDWDTNNAARSTEVRNLVVSRLQGLPASLTKDISGRITIQFLPSASHIDSIRISIVAQPYKPVMGFAGVMVPKSLSASAEFRYEGNL